MIVGFTSFTSIGCTFLDWSFYWLSGRDKFWADGIGWLELSSNPLQLKNAHNHKKNHPGSLIEWDKMIKNLKSRGEHFHSSFYGYQENTYYHTSDICNIFLEKIDLALNAGVKIIYLHKSTSYPYFKERAGSDNNILLQDLKSWCSFWFPNIKNIEQKINSVGGLRDFVSYNMNFLRARRLYDQLEYNLRKKKDKILFLDSKDLYCNGFENIKKIFNFLQLPIKQDRVAHWLSIYKKWSENFDEFDKFEKLLPKISKYIIEGKNFNLEMFLPNIINEVLILEQVMLTHGQRLKIKDLDIFPKNTIELHQLIKK